MPLLECLILRTGVTPVTLGNSKMIYRFMPIPGSKKDEQTTSVCDVTDEEHVKYLLRTKQYRVYDPDRAYKDLLARRGEEAAAPSLTGFKFEKYHEMGYVVVDQRDKEKRFLDSTGWHGNTLNLMPFNSEAEAFEALKEEVEFERLEAEESKKKPPLTSKQESTGGKQAAPAK